METQLLLKSWASCPPTFYRPRPDSTGQRLGRKEWIFAEKSNLPVKLKLLDIIGSIFHYRVGASLGVMEKELGKRRPELELPWWLLNM